MRTTGRVLIVVALLLLVALIVIVVRWQNARTTDAGASFLAPRVRMAQLQVQRLDPEATKLLVGLVIDQPAPIRITVDSVEYALFIGEQELVRSTYAKTITLPARDSVSIELPITVRTQKLFQVLKELEQAGVDSVEYALEASFFVPVAFWREKPFQVRMGQRLPSIRLPKVAMRHLVVSRFGFGKSDLTIDVVLFNPNNVAFSLRGTEITAQLEGKEVLRATHGAEVQVPARDTVVLTLPMRAAPGRMIEGIFDLLVNPSRTPYSYQMEFILSTDQPSLNNSRISLVGDGMLDDLKGWKEDAPSSKKD